MADDAVKTLVAKLNLDGSNIADVIKDARAQLTSFSDASKAQAAADQSATAAAIAGTKDQVEATKQVTAAKQESTNAAISGAAKEKSAKDEMYNAELENLRKKGELLDVQNEKIKTQIELMRERAKESSKGEGSEEGGVSVSGIAGALGAGAFGSGIVGSTLGGLLKGAGLTLGIEAAYEGMTKLTEKVKEFIEDSGGLQKVTETFQNLAPTKGANPTEFLEQLRAATHNLVNDVDLLREANTFMQSGLKMSSEDMVKLTAATVGLARSQGNDAQVAVQQLTRAFLSGRTSQLGFATGIQRTLLTVTGLGNTLSETAKSQLTFAQTTKLIEDRFSALGQPMLTYTDRLKQLSVVQGQLFEGAAQGTVTSQGFTSFMKTLGGIIDRLGGMEELARNLGASLGNVFAVVGAGFVTFGDTAKAALTPVKTLVDSLGEALGFVKDNWTTASSSGDTFTDALQRQHPILLANIKFMAELGRQAKLLIADFTAGGDTFMLPVRTADIMSQKQKTDKTGQYSGMMGQGKLFKDSFTQAQQELDARYQASSDEADKSYNDIVSGQSNQYMRGMKDRNPRYTGKVVPPASDPGQAQREALADAKATMDAQVAAAKESISTIKELTEEAMAVSDKLYKDGTITADEYYARKDKAALMSRDVSIEAAKAEAEARLKYLDVQVAQHRVFGSAATIQQNAINSGRDSAINQANTQYTKSISGDDEGRFAANKAATNKAAQDTLTIQKTSLQEQVDATKFAFDQNAISADEYLKERTEQIDAEYQNFVDAQHKMTLTAAEEIESRAKIAEAYEQKQRELAQLNQAQPGAAISSITRQYQGQSGINAVQQQMAAISRPQSGPGADELRNQQEQATQAYISELTIANTKVEAGSQLWQQTYLTILKAKAELQEMQAEDKTGNAATTLGGGLMSAIGTAGTGLFTGTFGRGFMNSFSQGASFMAGSAKMGDQWGSGQNSDSPDDSNVFSALKTSIMDVSQGDSGSFKELTGTLTDAAQAVGGFAKVIASSTSPLGGAFGGAQAGAGLGQSLGLGPLGALGGAAGGAILGAIVGQKQQQVQQDIVNIQLAARQMQEAFSAGSASLNSTITTLQGLITTLTQEQSSSKKGSSQFQDLINQYNQQLSQLEAQQTQVIQQMTSQLASVSSPEAYQQWIQNIDSVIQQYAQFAGAAQNATQLAQANEYLTSSLQNIGQQMGDQLMQEEESAIQNALQLNQLYNQRNQLELEYLNQVQSIMSQGNVTRQRTQAQSAFSQLYDAQVNYSQQLDSINQQINLAQYQLNVEQQIFNLATTKAGLESQLLSLQEQGVNEDMQRIVAMQNLLQTLQSTGYSITNLSSLSANDPNALQNTLLQDLINELGTGQGTMIQQLTTLINVLTEYGGLPAVTGSPATPNVSSTTGTNPNVATDMLSALYQSRAQFGYGAYRAQNL